MPVKISKTFRWEMAHRLANHTGGCENIHGHSYRLVVEVQGQPDESGMVIEFAVIRQCVRPVIDSLDHAFFCQDTDRIMLDFLTTNGMKHVVVPFPTTVENLTTWVAEQIADSILGRRNISALTVRIHETSTAYAEVRLEVTP